MSYLSELQVRMLGLQPLWQCHFDLQAYSDCQRQALNITLPSEMLQARPKRQAEFVAGRVMALKALRNAGCDCAELPIGEHRAPIWPQGWRGSISHTDDLAIAAIAPAAEVSLLGIDVENLIATPQLTSLMPLFVNPKEQALLAPTGLSAQSFATLVFSAKESIFKAIYPYVQTYLEFSDAMLTGIDMTKRVAYFTLCEQGEAHFGSALILPVYFLFEAEKVYTLVCAK